MTASIETVSARNRLKPRREPYWQRDSKGHYVGFRKMTADSAGTWWARHRDEASGKQIEHALGDLADVPDHQRFDRATAAARARRCGGGGT